MTFDLPPTFKDEEHCLRWLWRKRFSDDGRHADCSGCAARRRFKRYETKDAYRCWWCTGCGWPANPLRDTFLARTKLPLTAWFVLIRLVANEHIPIVEMSRQSGIKLFAVRRAVPLIEAWLAEGGQWPDERRGYALAKRHPHLGVDRRGVCGSCGGSTWRQSSRRCITCLRAERAVEHAQREAERAAEVASVIELEPKERKAVLRAYRNRRAPTDVKLTDKQKAIIRLLKASPRPLGATALSPILATLPKQWVAWEPSGILSSLRRLEQRGLVMRATNDARAHRLEPKIVWLVPSDGAVSDGALTLSDALREHELAALIAEQEQEITHGAWADVDFQTRSLDAALSDDGGSLHDVFEDVS